jgi:N-acetylmuramoyl-L-alanine amidase
VRSFHHHFRGIDGDTLDAQDLRVLYALSRQLTDEPSPGPALIAPAG